MPACADPWHRCAGACMWLQTLTQAAHAAHTPILLRKLKRSANFTTKNLGRSMPGPRGRIRPNDRLQRATVAHPLCQETVLHHGKLWWHATVASPPSNNSKNLQLFLQRKMWHHMPVQIRHLDLVPGRNGCRGGPLGVMTIVDVPDDADAGADTYWPRPGF